MSCSVYCWAATHTGTVRPNNEDAFLTSGQCIEDQVDKWEGPLASDGWAIVADGMGGYDGGEVASALATQCLASVLQSLSTEEEIRAAIEATNEALFDAMEIRPDLRGMGTTIAGVRLLGEKAILFNVGDSRIYWRDGDELLQVSEDHVISGHVLTKCLGGGQRQQPTSPYITRCKKSLGANVVLCTDGITNELADDVIQQLTKGDDPAIALVAAAVSAGGRDNATAIVVRFS